MELLHEWRAGGSLLRTQASQKVSQGAASLVPICRAGLIPAHLLRLPKGKDILFL